MFGRNAVLGITGLHLVRVAHLSSFAALAYSYALLVCPHSPRWSTAPTRCSFDLVFADLRSDAWHKRRVRHHWPTSRTCCSSALIPHAGVMLLPVSRLTSFLLTYIRMCGRNAMLGIGGLHLVRVARSSLFAALAYSYTLLICPHSPRWRTAPTRFSFDLVFADLHSDVWQKRRVRHRLPTSCTCCSFVHIRRTGLLVDVARLPSFSLLANISYWLLVGPDSPRWLTVSTRRSSTLILHAGLLLLRVARLTSILLTYLRKCGRNAVLGIGGLYLVRVARLFSLAELAYSYALLVCPHSPRWRTAPSHFSLDLIFADLHLYVWQKRRVRHRWPTSRTSCSSALILLVGQHLVPVARWPSFSTLAYCSNALVV